MPDMTRWMTLAVGYVVMCGVVSAVGRHLDGPVAMDDVGKFVAVTDDAVPSAGGDGTTSVDLLPGAKPPVAPTYRNAYGTQFDVSPTWTLLLAIHVVLVLGGLTLLSVIPVRFATNEKKEAPFVLWFGSPEKMPEVEHVAVEEQKQKEKTIETESLWHRASSGLSQILSSFFAAAPKHDTDVRYRFHVDMTQQLTASAVTAKTYESIAIATDDLEVKPPPSRQTYTSIAVSTDDLELKPPPPPQEASSEGVTTEIIKVKGLPPVFPTDNKAARVTRRVGPPPSRTLPRPSSRSSTFATAPPSPPSQSIGRRSRANSGASVVETREDFVRAASQRQSIAARAERRVALAREDVSYENLEDDEMQVYEYLEFVRELLDGLALKKLCQKSGRVVSRTLYITADMQVVFWNSIGAIKRQSQKSSLRTERIASVQRGLHGSVNVTARSTPEREGLCVSIHCSDGKWLALEAKTEAMRQRLFLGFTRLAQETHEQEAATAPVVPLQPTISEGVEEEIDKQEEQKTQTITLAESQERGMTRIEAEFQLEREERDVSFKEIQESDVVVQQLDFEEKTPSPLLPPPLEEELLQREILSIRATYKDQSDDDQQGENGRRGEEEPDVDIREHEDVQTVESHPIPLIEAEEESQQEEIEQEEEEKEEEGHEDEQIRTAEQDEHKAEERAEENALAFDGDDIDNLSDDPELSRE